MEGAGEESKARKSMLICGLPPHPFLHPFILFVHRYLLTACCVGGPDIVTGLLLLTEAGTPSAFLLGDVERVSTGYGARRDFRFKK